MNAYTFNGIQVIILFTSEANGAQPIHTCNDLGLYRTEDVPGEVGLLTEDDAYSGYNGPAEIVCTRCVNPENEEHLTEGYWTKDWAEADLAERELCTRTTERHDWTSRRTETERRLEEASEANALDEAAADAFRKEWEQTAAALTEGFSSPLGKAVTAPAFDELLEAAHAHVTDRLEQLARTEGYHLHTDPREAIAAALAASDMNAAQLSAAAGIATSSISRYLNGRDGLNYDNLCKVLRALGIRLIY